MHECQDNSNTQGLTHNDLTWLVYIIEPPDGNIGAWHDSIKLNILGINIRVQYIRYKSEYILKLQLHQHYGHVFWWLVNGGWIGV